MPVFRIRRYSGRKNGSNYYYHADVEAENQDQALQFAKNGKVRNWRWIDTFDKSNKDYCYYEFLYEVI